MTKSINKEHNFEEKLYTYTHKKYITIAITNDR